MKKSLREVTRQDKKKKKSENSVANQITHPSDLKEESFQHLNFFTVIAAATAFSYSHISTYTNFNRCTEQ